MEKAINLSQISSIKDFSSEYSTLNDEYIFSHITRKSHINFLAHGPFRIDGMMFLLNLKGTLHLDINLNSETLTDNSMMITGPNNIISPRTIDGDEIDCYTIFVSSEFIHDTNMDINVLNSMPTIPHSQSPIISITPEEANLIKLYFDLLHRNTTDNTDDVYIRSISRNLLASVAYQLMQFMTKRVATDDKERPRSRRSTYVYEFRELVHRHHRKERSVSFYADKMFISPKYLSLIIKEATGRSASEWIDEYVILEAKNMLRFSGKNVQQIAYELNFSNQSSFGKYFKHLTGMSPTQYQRS